MQELQFFLIKGAEIQVESTLQVEKIYDGNTNVDPDKDVKGEVKLAPGFSVYEEKLEFVPE